jgi:hypothetical protein
MLFSLSARSEPQDKPNAAQRMSERRRQFEAKFMRSYAEMRARRRRPA